MTAQATCRWWLASLALLLAAAAAAGAPAADEGAVMRALRQAAAEVGLSAGLRWAGWAPGDRTHHCLWHNVVCDDAQHVTRMWVLRLLLCSRPPLQCLQLH